MDMPEVNYTNQNTDSYVSWNWLATSGTAASSNIRLVGGGTTTSSVSANTKAGFSISFDTGTGASSTDHRCPHGLDSAPEMVWLKSRDSDNYGAIYHASMGLKYWSFLGAK